MERKDGEIEKMLLFKTVLTEAEWSEAQRRAKCDKKRAIRWVNSAISKSYYG